MSCSFRVDVPRSVPLGRICVNVGGTVLLELSAEREQVVVLTAPWHERDYREAIRSKPSLRLPVAQTAIISAEWVS
jgi:hypothetical protein